MVEHVVADAGAFLKNAALHVRVHGLLFFMKVTLKRLAVFVFISLKSSVYN